MALNIDGATIGYDANSMATTLDHIHNNCVVEAQNSLRTNMATLRESVHACWVGQSANTYLENMQTDVDQIIQGLEEAYRGLEAEFKKALSGLAEIDQQLVDKR